MVHLTNTLRSVTFLLGTAMLMLFLFCAPMHAQTPTFKSTSSYKIANPNYSAQQLDPTTIGHETYRSTIYTPFGSSTPSSNNNPGGNNDSGSGTDDDDVGIPGWADTPSEPLPIGDSTPLFWLAAAMIAIIAIKQRRKQKQLSTQTSSNHSNNDTNEMTLTQHNGKSFRKLLMLALLLCVVGEVSGQNYSVTELFNYSRTKGNLPANFPTGSTGNYYYAHQATYINDAFYTNDGKNKIIKITKNGVVSEWAATQANPGLQYGTCRDDAGNLIVNTSNYPRQPQTITVYPNDGNGPTTTGKTKITLSETIYGRCNYISAKGNVLSGTGYIYFFPGQINSGDAVGQNLVKIATITDGACTSITTHTQLSVTSDACGGYVIPIDGLNHYIYNERSTSGKGYYLYNDGDQGALMPDVAYNDVAPTRNATYGGAYFTLGDHKMFVYGSGVNYAGGWTMRDLSNGLNVVHNEGNLRGSLDGNQTATENNSYAAFFTYERVNDHTVKLYEYCLGMGIAGWEICDNDYKNFKYRVQTCESGNVFDTKTCDATGGSLEMTATDGKSLTISKANGNDQGYQYISHHNDVTITCTAVPNSGYVFVGWWNRENGQFTDNPWINKTGNIDDYVTARFASVDNICEQTITVSGLGSATITHNLDHEKTRTTPITRSVTANAWINTNVTLTATPTPGYSFVGWYEGQNLVSKDATYTYTATSDRNITAYFAEGEETTTLQVRAMVWNGTTLAKEETGGTFTLTHSGGVVYQYQQQQNKYEQVVITNSPVTFCATINDGHEFIGWFNVTADRRFLVNPWIMKDPFDISSEENATTKYRNQFTAVFAPTDYAKKQNIKFEGLGTVTANYTYYSTSTKEVVYEYNSSFIAWNNTDVTLTATPLEGYVFDGWYDSAGTKVSANATYNYTVNAATTLTAKFKQKVHKLSVSVLNYNPEYDKFEEYGYEYNTVTLTQGSTTVSSYSSLSQTFDSECEVTLTATPEEGEEGYDFVGWYINNEKLTQKGSNSLYTLNSDDSKVLTINLSGAVAVDARFAPRKCYYLEIRNNIGGTFTVRHSKNEQFNPASTTESALDQYVYTYIPYGGVWIDVPHTKPILGYEFKGSKVLSHGGNIPVGGKFNYTWENHTQIAANFVRKDDQVVYLNLNGLSAIPNTWLPGTGETTTYYAYVYNTLTGEQLWIEMTQVEDKCYTCTIPGGKYNRLNFVHSTNLELDQITNFTITDLKNSGKEKRRSDFLTIPATRYNCYRIRGVYSSNTGSGKEGYVDGWVAPPTQIGDYRLIYIEQEVASKTEINRTYEFNEGDRIKKIASGTKTDIVSLHIYNKVSKDNNGNLTGTALNNPEIILQQWDGTTWVDRERHMVFGPLQTDNTGHIRMPGRKNTAPVVDLGIDNIKKWKTDATEDYGCGVWNFVIEQNGATARLVIDQTHRYTGNYYIRTPNAEGQYHNFTHPGNIMSYSEYAKNNSDYSHYFIRYVDIYEDGTPTAEAGKHPVVKFCVANDYAINLCKEFTNTQNRFEPEEDIYVLNAGDLPADATVRFGWDIKTNRLTRAYIANTTIKNNEYLVVEGEEGNNKIGSPSGDAVYFTDNSNWLYSIDLPDAKAGAKAKVKAKMNGQYQYFMGSGLQDGYETLISGNGTNTYPIRLLYDFKDDRFTTIYRPSNTDISGTVILETPVMIEREHNEAPTQIKFANNAKFVVNGNFDQPAYAVMTFLEEKLANASITHHEKMFYWISFPFDVCIRDVFGLGDYGKYWIMEEYNGAQRAASGLAQNNWKYITKKSAILEANKGYVLCLNYSQILQDQLFKSYGGSDKTLNSGKLSLYFPSNSVISPEDITGGQERTVTLARYENNNTAWNHHNWHIIGVPSFANPEGVDFQYDIPFVYQYWHPSDAYAAKAYDEITFTFQAMHAYMVQYHGDITWQNIVNTGNGSVTPMGLAAKKDTDADKKIMLRLELQQAGSTIDKTYVQLRDDKGTLGFDMSLDLTKIINAGANIYSIVDNHEMAGNAIPKEETILPLGVVITAAGEYTFAMPNGTEGMIVELIDYEQGTCTNLLVGDYTVNMPEGTNNTRFALRLKPDKVATSVEDITSGTNDNNVRKLLIDGVLYLVTDDAVYNTQGKLVK